MSWARLFPYGSSLLFARQPLSVRSFDMIKEDVHVARKAAAENRFYHRVSISHSPNPRGPNRSRDGIC